MRSTGHFRERSPGSWEIRYSLGTDPATGKRKTATATVRGTRKDAEKELRRLLRAVDTGEHVDPTRLTVAQWLQKWLRIVHEEVELRTHERYGEIVDHFLVPALGNLPIGKLTVTHIQDAYAGWATSGRRDGKEGGLSAQTRRHFHRVLNAALVRAVEQKVIARNPCDALNKKKRLPKVEHREMQVLNADQSGLLLENIKTHRVYWPVLIALSTGMRRGEILALRWRHIDFEQGTIQVLESLEHTKVGGFRFKRPKSGKARAISLPAYAVDELRRLKHNQAEELLKIGVRQDASALVCARADGEPMLPTSLTHEFAKMARRVDGVPKVRFHDLRHSHATQLLAAGVHPKIAQERLGHSSISMTLDLYSHVTETMQKDAAARLDTIFRTAVKHPRK